MRFAKTIGLNSLSAKVLLAYVAGAVLSILLIMAAAFAIVSTQGDVLSGADVEGTTEDLARELLFNSDGVPVGFDVDDFDPTWAFESLKQEAAYRVLDAAGNVVLSSPAGEAFWRDSVAARRLERSRFEFEREGVAMRGATEVVEHKGRLWFVQ